jgi:hypothetical protein
MLSLSAYAGTEVRVEVPVTATAKEQVELAQRYSSEAAAARPENLRTACAKALSAWRLIRERFPQAKPAVVYAALNEADLWLKLSAPLNAVEVLEAVAADARGTESELGVDRRLGLAFTMLHRSADAETAFARAEKHAGKSGGHAAVMTLNDFARFYRTEGRHRDAALVYRKLSKLSSVHPGARITAALHAAEQMLRVNDRRGAKDDVEIAGGLMRELRNTNPAPQLVETLESHVEAMRNKVK